MPAEPWQLHAQRGDVFHIVVDVDFQIKTPNSR